MSNDNFESLNNTEVEQAMKIGEDLKYFLGDAVADRLCVALEQGLAEHVFRCAVTTECLLLAAHMYSGDPRSFLIMAGKSYATAQESRRMRPFE
jgi:hypothetical protein